METTIMDWERELAERAGYPYAIVHWLHPRDDLIVVKDAEGEYRICTRNQWEYARNEEDPLWHASFVEDLDFLNED